jgi:hypothetical protein
MQGRAEQRYPLLEHVLLKAFQGPGPDGRVGLGEQDGIRDGPVVGSLLAADELNDLDRLDGIEFRAFGRDDHKVGGLVQPPTFRPGFPLPAGVVPEVAYVWKTEEKGSDVNLGVHLVRDAFMGEFDEAAILTNDTDLVEAVRIVTREVGLPVALLTPENKPAGGLVCAGCVTYVAYSWLTTVAEDPAASLTPAARSIDSSSNWRADRRRRQGEG